jgi:hypothetical protein
MTRIIESVKDVITGIEADAIVASFRKLLDSRKTARFPNVEYTFMGPAEDLLKRMKKAVGTEGLPKNADQLVTWLKAPPNAKLIRKSGVLIELPEKFCNRNCTFICLERAVPTPEHRPLYPPF